MSTKKFDDINTSQFSLHARFEQGNNLFGVLETVTNTICMQLHR